MSLRPVTSCSPVACSGLRYCVIPSVMPRARIRSAPACHIATETPQSVSFAPSRVRMIASGLRSRCAIPCSCAN